MAKRLTDPRIEVHASAPDFASVANFSWWLVNRDGEAFGWSYGDFNVDEMRAFVDWLKVGLDIEDVWRSTVYGIGGIGNSPPGARPYGERLIPTEDDRPLLRVGSRHVRYDRELFGWRLESDDADLLATSPTTFIAREMNDMVVWLAGQLRLTVVDWPR